MASLWNAFRTDYILSFWSVYISVLLWLALSVYQLQMALKTSISNSEGSIQLELVKVSDVLKLDLIFCHSPFCDCFNQFFTLILNFLYLFRFQKLFLIWNIINWNWSQADIISFFVSLHQNPICTLKGRFWQQNNSYSLRLLPRFL